MYNTRWVSTVIHGHPNEDLEDNQMSLMVMQFGQFLGLVQSYTSQVEKKVLAKAVLADKKRNGFW